MAFWRVSTTRACWVPHRIQNRCLKAISRAEIKHFSSADACARMVGTDGGARSGERARSPLGGDARGVVVEGGDGAAHAASRLVVVCDRVREGRDRRRDELGARAAAWSRALRGAH